jgi:Methyltransferase domain
MSATAVRTFPEWLRLREPADAEARSVELVDELRRHLPAAGPLVIHDLGGGSGAMGRWLAPRLPQPQHWVIHDRDEDLLALAVADPPAGATVEARRGDITRPAPDALAGADVVVASALLDMLTADELTRMLAACAGRPLLIAMTVTGRVSFAPPEPLDVPLGVAFNAHQRRDGRLGPDAVPAALEALGGEVLVRPSPWHLGAAHAELMTAWFGGWVDAACEKEPELASEARAYRERRLTQAHEATVDHADLLVLP